MHVDTGILSDVEIPLNSMVDSLIQGILAEHRVRNMELLRAITLPDAPRPIGHFFNVKRKADSAVYDGWGWHSGRWRSRVGPHERII